MINYYHTISHLLSLLLPFYYPFAVPLLFSQHTHVKTFYILELFNYDTNSFRNFALFIIESVFHDRNKAPTTQKWSIVAYMHERQVLIRDDISLFYHQPELSFYFLWFITLHFLFVPQVWLSVLGPVYATDYKDVLIAARNSFQLLKSNIPILWW